MNVITSVPNPHGNNEHSPGFVEDTGDTMTGDFHVGATKIEFSAGGGYLKSTVGLLYLSPSGGGYLQLGTSGITWGVAINTANVLFPVQAPTISSPAYVEGGMYFDTTVHKLKVGGAAAWETPITEESLFIQSQTPQVLTGAGAVSLTTAITHIITASGADAVTLADGVEGQHKTIVMKTITTGGDTSIITPDHFANGSTITGNSVGDIQNMMFTNGAWHWTGGRGAVIA